LLPLLLLHLIVSSQELHLVVLLTKAGMILNHQLMMHIAVSLEIRYLLEP
jgi:hypothetical protein